MTYHPLKQVSWVDRISAPRLFHSYPGVHVRTKYKKPQRVMDVLRRMNSVSSTGKFLSRF